MDEGEEWIENGEQYEHLVEKIEKRRHVSCPEIANVPSKKTKFQTSRRKAGMLST